MITHILAFFDQRTYLYWAAAWTALGCLIALAAKGRSPVWYATALAFAALAFRWPMAVAGRQFNPDEEQLFAGALTYGHDPVPWRSVDLHTAGPIAGYFLLPSAALPERFSYLGLRLTCLACQIVPLILVYGLFRRWSGDRVARWAVLPGFACVAFTSYWDLVQYSSEDAAIVLLVLGAFLMGKSKWRTLLGGIAFGAVVFAKLQAVPLIAGYFVVGLAVQRGADDGAGRSPFPWRSLLAGAALPSLALGTVLSIFGLWRQFGLSFISANLAYSAAGPGRQEHMMAHFIDRFVELVPGFTEFFWGAVALGGVAAVWGCMRPSRQSATLIASGITVVLAYICITVPGRQFEHYLRLIIIPLTLFAGFGVLSLARRPVRAGWWVAATILIGLVPQVVARIFQWHPALGHTAEAFAEPADPLVDRIRSLAGKEDQLVIWGWRSDFYLKCRLVQGTRDAHFEREIASGTMLGFYRERYLHDLDKKRPRFLVDAVGPQNFLYTSAGFGPSSWPELADYLKAHYSSAGSFETGTLYLRR